MNSTSVWLEDDDVRSISPVPCYKLIIKGVVYTILFIACVIFNAILLGIFFRNKKLQNSFNLLVITLTVMNLVGSLLEFPFVIPSNFYCKLIIEIHSY